MAKDRGIAVKQLLREFHLHKLGTLAIGQTRLPTPAILRICRLTGVGEPALHAMTLARFAGNALPHLPPNLEADAGAIGQWHAGAWLCDRHLRWCPRCLRENGRRWSLRWLLPWTFACLKHRVYLASECQRCQSVVTPGADCTFPSRCEAGTANERFHRYGYDERCDFPVTKYLPVPVSDSAVLSLQARINAWLDGAPTADDRRLVSLTAVLTMLLSPAMLRRGDPVLLFAVRSLRAPRPWQERALWTDPLRVAAAACAADRMLQSNDSAAEVAHLIADYRTVDYRTTPWRLDAMDWAYGPALRPNVYVDELVRRGTITIGSYHLR